MPSITAPIIGGIVTGGAGLASSAISGSAAKSAASTQANAETQAAQEQTQAQEQATAAEQQQFQQTQEGLAPYNQAGQAATGELQGLSPFSFSPTQAQLEATPGYQFNLSQGLKSTQNGYAAQGLGSSGAALKGAASYASGLADTTYQNQFNNALSTYNTNLGKLQNLAGIGESAAANTGAFGTQTATNIGNQGITTAGNIGQTAVGSANAIAAGTVGAANASSNAFSSLGNAYLYSNLFNQNTPSIYSPSIPGNFNSTGGQAPEFY